MNPYQETALTYLGSGLGYPIPSAFPYEKHPPIGGWTGRQGATPTPADVLGWTETHPDSNILIRMAPDVIGIDVDHYDGKHGYDTLKAISRAHNHLPPTHVSSARDMPSGIYWFRLAPWMDTDGMRDPGEHVEVIRYGHRYACAPSSWHPGIRARYQWSEGHMPMRWELGLLPTEWYVHLNRGCDCFEQERAESKRQMTRIMNRPSGSSGVNAALHDLSMASNTLRQASPGMRNNMLSSIAGKFLMFDVVINEVLDAATVMTILYDAGVSAGLEPEETKRTIESALEWAVREGNKG